MPSAGITAVLGALVLFSALTQLLEYTLVNAVGGDTIKDMPSYLAVLNRPPTARASKPWST